MNTNNITEQEITNEKESLQEEEKELTEEYTKLEQQLNDLQTVIRCQTQKNEIVEKMKKITLRLYEVKSKLLEESEEMKRARSEIKS